MNKLKLICTILFLLLAQLLYCQAENASVSLEELQEIEIISSVAETVKTVNKNKNTFLRQI